MEMSVMSRFPTTQTNHLVTYTTARMAPLSPYQRQETPYM